MTKKKTKTFFNGLGEKTKITLHDKNVIQTNFGL